MGNIIPDTLDHHNVNGTNYQQLNGVSISDVTNDLKNEVDGLYQMFWSTQKTESDDPYQIFWLTKAESDSNQLYGHQNKRLSHLNPVIGIIDAMMIKNDMYQWSLWLT